MTDKHIIIDGEKENCKILFDCYHIDDSEAYRMIRNGVKITPENAPFDDFELRLISNENSVYGFTSLCKRNKNNDEWEYMGFGHSGAASVVTALLKELSRKEQECEELKKIIDEAKNSKLDLNSFFAIEATVGEYQLELDQLKAENDELKDKVEGLTILGMDLNQSNELLRKTFFATDKSRDNWREKAEKYSRTLTEIKEIIHFNKTNRLSGGADISIAQILQKISEVEE